MKDLWKAIAIVAIWYTILQLGLKWHDQDHLIGLAVCALLATGSVTSS